jgi:hypothetical protein
VGGSVIDGLADLPTERTISRWIIRIEQTDKEMTVCLSVILADGEIAVSVVRAVLLLYTVARL